jgi:hypothetical protein
MSVELDDPHVTRFVIGCDPQRSGGERRADRRVESVAAPIPLYGLGHPIGVRELRSPSEAQVPRASTSAHSRE